MQRLLTLIISLILFGSLNAQTPIAAAEYFIDTDPGEGKGTAISAKDGTFDTSEEDISLTLNTTSLAFGAHTVFIRFQDNTGIWGHLKSKQITISNPNIYTVENAEYFINTDPGEGQGTAISPADGSFDTNSESISVSYTESGLGLGQHSIFVRFKGSDGKWGSPKASNFLKNPPADVSTINGAEYFIDTDPGEGNGTALAAKDGGFDSKDETSSLSLSTGDISFGAHILFTRFKDSNGIWSKPKSKLITISNPDTASIAYTKGAEFYIDSDPGRGLGTALAAQDGIFNDTTETLTGTYVDNYAFTHGTHSLNVRAINSKGNWGEVSSTALQIVDVTKPTVTVFSATTSPTSTSPIPISITFNEPVTGFESKDVNVSNGSKGAVFGSNKTYTMEVTPITDGNIGISVPAGGASDLGSNTNTASTTFNIKYDNTNPYTVSFSPADESFGVNKNSNLQITFNENIYKGEGDLSIYKSVGSLFETINVATDQISVSGSGATINPNGTFSIGTTYYVKIGNNMFKDEAGNFFEGIYNSSSWNFSVVSDTEYPATEFISSLGVEVGTLEITDDGTINDIAVKVNVSGNTSNFLRYVSLSLISPSGTSVYLVGGDQIKSGGLGSNAGSSFTNTIFSDGADKSIYSGSSPFIGNFKPQEALSAFDGESLEGTWSLVFNNMSSDADTIDWSILANADETAPSQPISYGTEYKGSQVNSSLGVNVDTIKISESGTLTDLETEITIKGSASNFLRYTSIVLISPKGTPVYLFGGDQIRSGGIGQYSGPDMYKTIFDDESNKQLTSGFAPFIGPHKPVDLLSKINGESIAGTWTLVLTNNNGSDVGTVDWSLFLESDNSTPRASPDIGVVYTGKQLTTSSVGVINNAINISSSDTLTNLYVEATIDGSTSNFLRYVSLSLQSPKGTVVNLFSGDQVTSGGLNQYSGSDMYLTQFNDEARVKINAGKAPFVGPHKPSDTLKVLNGEILNGDWTIYFNNKSNDSGTLDWKLFANPATTIPHILISSSEGGRTTKTSIPITVSFTEEVIGFDTSKIKITNGGINNFSGSGADYTFDITPVIQGYVTVNIAENVAQDISGNGNVAATMFSIYFDKIPTVVVSSTSASPTNSIPIPIKITFSEEVSGFDSLDVSLSNALLSGFIGSKDVYEFQLNPIAAGDMTVKIPANAAKDTTNNGNLESATFTIKYTTVPSVVISSSVDSITNVSPIPMKVTFSKDVIGFIATDIIFNNGSLNQFSGTGSDYNFNLVPTSDGKVTVDINANVASDSDANGNYGAQQFSVIYDKTSPRVTISTTVQTPTQSTLIPISLEFTESVIGFDSADVLIDNGVLKDITGWGKSFSFNVVPQGAGYIGIIFPAGKVNDIAGNGNEASEYFTIKYDNNIHLDSFDNLDTWTNSTNSSTSGDLWYIVADGYSGNAARSDVGGFGYGDKLSKEFDFTADVKVKLWVKKQSGYAIKAYFKSDNEELWSFGDSGDQTNQFVQKEALISKGKHTISIETDYSGSVWIDELAIETVTNPLVSISTFFISPTNSGKIPINVIFTNPVTGFEQNDITVGNGNISNFSGSEMNYSFDVTPVSEGDVTIDIPANVAQDENSEGNNEAIQFVINYDVSAPQPQLTWDLNSLTNKTQIPINVSFNEPVKNLLSSDFKLANCKVDSFSGKDSLYYLQISPIQSGILNVELPASTLNDLAGNENIISNQLSTTFDGIIPIAGLVNDGDDEDIDFQMNYTTIKGSWNGFKDNETGIKEYKWAIGKEPGGTAVQAWQSVSLNKSASNDGLNIEDGKYFISVMAVDSAGNESNIVSSDGVNVDTKPPIAPGNLNATPGDMSITLTWSSNTEIDLKKYIIHRSEISGFIPSESDSIGEIEFRETIYTDNNPEWGKNYFYRVAAKDSTGYLSEYSDEANSTPYDLTMPIITINEPLQKTLFEIGTFANIKWTGFDNSGYLTVNLDYKYDNNDWIPISTEEENDGAYSWLVPNTPSKNVSIRVIGKDGYNNTDTSSVTNIEIYIVYPTVLSINPPSGVLNWYNEGIRIEFSRPMNPTTLDLDNIKFQAIHSQMPSLSYDNNTNILIIGENPGFVSSDTISFSIDVSSVKSTYGYELNGIGGNDINIVYTTAMYADYDTSSTIDDIDLAFFVQGLENDNLQYELGPVVGTPPHFNANLDAKYDIEDLMAFIMMWNWYVSNIGSTFNEYITMGEEVHIESAFDSIIVNIPGDILTYQIQVKYPTDIMNITTPRTEHEISFSYNDEDDGIFIFLSKNYGNKKVVIRTSSKLKGNNVLVNFRGIGSDGSIIAQTIENIYVEGVPEQFALHQNYPNPFNPITTINYDLPQQTHVNLLIYDILGREVVELVNKEMSAGYQSIIWNGKNKIGVQVSAGIYFYHIQTKNFVNTRKMVLLK